MGLLAARNIKTDKEKARQIEKLMPANRQQN